MVRLRIDELLEARGKTWYWLAIETGMGHMAAHNLRHARAKTIRLDYIEKLCAALECEPGDLFEIVGGGRKTKDKGK